LERVTVLTEGFFTRRRGEAEVAVFSAPPRLRVTTVSFTTSATSLSSRIPRNAGCRSRLSAVHSVKATCTTKRGFTHVATFTRGASLTIVCGTTSFDNSSFHQTRCLAEKPVPTLPA